MVHNFTFKQHNYWAVILLITAWILGNLWTFQWWLESFKSVSRLNLIVLGGTAIAVYYLLVKNSFNKLQLSSLRLNILPILFILGGEIGAIILKWSFNIPQLTLLCFILGSYGLLGLFIDNSIWRKGLTIATITAFVIPFLTAFNSGLGFPVRVITAHAVAQTLSDFHLGAISSHDIIVMENGIAQVDLPCSGMKSLWTGTVFLLGITYIEKRQLGFRWLLVAIANLSFLIVANILRVLILVIAIEVLQQRQIAEVLHLPLGILGFLGAIFITWLLLQKIPRYDIVQPAIKDSPSLKPFNFKWLLSTVIVLGIIGQINPNIINAATLNSINLPPQIIAEKLDLSKAEKNFFDNPANPLVEKVRFQSNNLSGSMLLVASSNWQTHHPPELCFLGNGFKIDNMESKLIDDSINARWLSLQDGELSATYWFQSNRSTTDDFIERIVDYVAHRNKTWVLVSILFDGNEQPDSRNIKDFTNSIYQTINQSLNHKINNLA
ncbi:MAG: exosortase O [Pleurocapsa sp.]